MKGLELSRMYTEEVVLPAFAHAVPELLSRMAFGLVGPGSECYGFDDEISRDHDWGPRSCIWIPDDLYVTRGAELQAIYDGLPGEFRGFGPVQRLDTLIPRDGVLPVGGFYRTHTGTASAPVTVHDWLRVPDEALGVATNGEVFTDTHGAFTRTRVSLLAYYPRDIRLKKIASRLRAAAQHGQYNRPRAARRGDRLAVAHHAAAFLTEIARLVYTLEKKYRPHDKWLFRGLLELGPLGIRVHEELEEIVAAAGGVAHAPGVTGNAGRGATVQDLIERCCETVATEVRERGFSRTAGAFLYDHGSTVDRQVEDENIRELYALE